MKAAFYTLGCKVNQYETQIMEENLASAGFDIVGHDEFADVYVINSCTVTAESDRKTRQIIRRMKKINPLAVTVLSGCFPQSFPEKAAALKEADVITGVKERGIINEIIMEAMKSRQRIVRVSEFKQGEKFEHMKAGGFIERTRAFVKIEDGCRSYCSYCIIPFSRGPVRSKPPGDLTDELKGLAAEGYREAVLVGINLSAYGSDIGLCLTDAIRAANGVEGIERIRLGSLEPRLITDDFIRAAQNFKKLCPHFHLSLQSGCAQTLLRMNRRYTPEQYELAVCKLRQAFPGCGITTDIIVGFPGETRDEFEQSKIFAEKIRFSQVHVFTYSRRSGTKAAEMPGQVENAEKERRSHAMIEACSHGREQFLASLLGQVFPVLYEEGHNGNFEGFAPNYAPVRVRSPGNLHGKIIDTRIVDIKDGVCLGDINL